MIIVEKRSHPLQGKISPQQRTNHAGILWSRLLCNQLIPAVGTPISFLIGGILSLVAAIVGWMMRKSAEKSLAESATTMHIE